MGKWALFCLLCIRLLRPLPTARVGGAHAHPPLAACSHCNETISVFKHAACVNQIRRYDTGLCRSHCTDAVCSRLQRALLFFFSGASAARVGGHKSSGPGSKHHSQSLLFTSQRQVQHTTCRTTGELAIAKKLLEAGGEELAAPPHANCSCQRRSRDVSASGARWMVLGLLCVPPRKTTETDSPSLLGGA